MEQWEQVSAIGCLTSHAIWKETSTQIIHFKSDSINTVDLMRILALIRYNICKTVFFTAYNQYLNPQGPHGWAMELMGFD